MKRHNAVHITTLSLAVGLAAGSAGALGQEARQITPTVAEFCFQLAPTTPASPENGLLRLEVMVLGSRTLPVNGIVKLIRDQTPDAQSLRASVSGNITLMDAREEPQGPVTGIMLAGQLSGVFLLPEGAEAAETQLSYVAQFANVFPFEPPFSIYRDNLASTPNFRMIPENCDQEKYIFYDFVVPPGLFE